MKSRPRLVVTAGVLICLALAALAIAVTPGHRVDAGDADADSRDSQVHISHAPAKPVPFSASSTITEFQGLSSSETYAGTTYFWTPGEPVIAVGPSAILQTANQAAAVFDKSGHKLAEFDFGTFWPGGTTSNPVECTDPRALYIASVDRFAISCSANSMLFAISRTSDPAGAWFTYKAPNTSFLDQDKIEATSSAFSATVAYS